MRVVVGGEASLDALAQLAASTTRELHLDVFKLTDTHAGGAVVDAARRVQVSALLDPEYLSLQLRGRLRDAGAVTNSYGRVPAKNHSKAAANERQGLISTAAYIADSRSRIDVSALLDGPGSAALLHLMRASSIGSSAAVVDAAQAAARHGILLNDPLHGVQLLTRHFEGMVSGAQHRILGMSKQFHDVDIAGRMAERAGTGVDVTIATRRFRSAEHGLLAAAGSDLREVPRSGTSLHGTVLVVDDQAYLGSAMLHHRSLNRPETTRLSREVGIVTTDAVAVAQLAGVVDGVVARGVHP